MKQQSSADKFHRRRAAMEKANKAKKDKFFEHDLRLEDTTSLDGGGSKDDDDEVDQVPGVTPDSSTNPEEMAAAALHLPPEIPSPTSSESSTDRTTVKSMVHVSKTPKSKAYFKKQQQTSRKKLLKKLRRLQQLQTLHPGIHLPPGLVPPGYRQHGPPAPTLRYGPSGKQCCCQCACTTLNNNHLKFQQHHHQPLLQQHQYQQQQQHQSDEPEVLQSSEPGSATTTFNRQFYQRHNQHNHHHHPVQHPQFPVRRPARGGAAAGPFCMKEMHSVVR